MYFKILNSHVEIDCEAFFEKNVNNNNQTRGHNFKLRKKFCPTDQLFNIFSSRVIDCWNWLPEAVVNCKTAKSFIYFLDKINLESFLKGQAL